jgi:hypothetical protein
VRSADGCWLKKEYETKRPITNTPIRMHSGRNLNFGLASERTASCAIYSLKTMRRLPCCVGAALVAIICAAIPAMADLGDAKSFVVLSSGGDVTFMNRVTVNKAAIPGAATCPGASGCTMRVGGGTVGVGPGNAATPDSVNGDVIARASASVAINLGNGSEVAGACVTGGGTVSLPSECSGGVDTSGANSEVTMLLPNAGIDAAAFSAFLAALPATRTLPAINLATNRTVTIEVDTGLNVLDVPSIVTGAKAAVTISGPAAAMVVINVGVEGAPGLLNLGNASSILLVGGITPDKVVFNIVGGLGGDPNAPPSKRWQSVRLGNNTTFNGTLLAPQQGFISGNGNTPSPIVINGALLFGHSIFVGNNVDINFYPAAQIARQGTLTLVGTVDINNLPPPVPGDPNTGKVEADDYEKAPLIESVPGQPGPPEVGSTVSLLDPPPGVILGFTALGNGNAKVPPDTQLAAGNTRLIEMVNVSGAMYGKLFGKLIKNFDLGSFFLTNKGQGTDPRVMFEAGIHEYYAAYELLPAGGDNIRLAVADEPGDTWTIYDVRSDNTGILFDQPKLGYSTGVVTLSWNDYSIVTCPPGQSAPCRKFTGTETIVIQKLGLLLRGASVPAVIWGPDTSHFQIVPVQSLTPSATQYAAYRNTGESNIHVMAFEGIPGIFDVSVNENSYGIGAVTQPPPASQPAGGNPTICDPKIDDRLLAAVWQNDNLWAAFNEGCTPQGDTTTRECERFVEVSTATNAVTQNVQLQSSGQDIYYAALTLTGNGDLFFGMTFSSPTLNPSAVVLGVPGANFSSVTGGVNYQPGTAAYNVTDSAGNFLDRWGDYSGAASDPNDPTVAWVAQEFSSGNWNTAITAAFFAPTPTPPPPK